MTSLLQIWMKEIRLRYMKSSLISCSLLLCLLILYYLKQTSVWSTSPVISVERELVLQIRAQRNSSGTLMSQIPSETSRLSVACNFPKQDPFHPLIMEYFKTYDAMNCSGGLPSLVYLKGNFLNVNTTKAKLKRVPVDICYYQTITRTSDFSINNSGWISFENSIEIGSEHENIVVKCHFQSKLVSKTYLTRIVKKGLTENICEKNYKRHIRQNSPVETLSVLLVGLDGTSRQNSIRSLTRTRNFLVNNMSAIEFYKFNKLGLNTFPNMLPMLSGLHEEDLRKLNWTSRRPFDSFNHKFLWHHYKQAGYRTALLLDSKVTTAFHYAKAGWKQSPVDYYHRPMTILRSNENVKNKHCVGDMPEVTFLLDYWHQLTTIFNNTKTKPYFAFSFFQRLTHNYPNKATVADHLYFNFFHDLVERNVLNNTVVVFFGDHGPRFGKLRRLRPGVLEANTPFLFVMFPRWFHTKYPDVISTFRTNQHRLTTFFDVHEFLKDILFFKGKTGKGNLHSRGISFFNEIPADRLCFHAGVPMIYCMCSLDTSVSSALSDRLTGSLLEHIVNKSLSKRSVCQIFNISSPNFVFPIRFDAKCVTCSQFHVIITANPGSQFFDGVLEHNSKSDTIVVLKERKVSGSTSTCVDKKRIPYCYCKSK